MIRASLSDLRGRVCDVAERAGVEGFVVGATANVAKCRSRLGAEDVVPIYEAASVEDAQEVERALIKHFAADPRCGNGPQHAYDDILLGDDDVISVYVAVWWTDAASTDVSNQ